MAYLRKRARQIVNKVTGAGGGGPAPTGTLAIGPDFGEGSGSDGKTFTVNAAIDLESLDLTGDTGVTGAINDDQYVMTYANAGSFTLDVPQNMSSAKIEVRGAGGGGGTATVNGGGGGGGGAYARTNALSVTPGATLTLQVGSGGAVANAGQDTWVSDTGVAPTSTSEGALAKGGSAGSNGSAGGQGSSGSGGASGSGIGDTGFSGGNGGGGGGLQTSGGGGGGGAGDAAVGGNGASNRTAGTGGSAGGGAGGIGGGTASASAAGTAPGGGGGGASATNAASAGAQGRIVITFT